MMLLLIARLVGAGLAFATVMMLLLSQRMVFFGTAMLTEGVAMAIVAGIALTLPWRDVRRSPQALATAAVLTVVLGFTRQATFIVAGALVMAWVGTWLRTRRVTNVWTPFAALLSATAVVVQVVQSLVWSNFSQADQFTMVTGTDSLSAALLAVPGLAWRIVTADVWAMARFDMPLLLLMTLAVVAGVVRWRHTESHLVIGAVMGIMLYNVTNGTPTMFRYGMPGMVFLLVCIAVFLRDVTGSQARSTDWPVARSVSAVPPEPAQHGVDGDGHRLRDEQPQPQ
jgi:hypothetical protein